MPLPTRHALLTAALLLPLAPLASAATVLDCQFNVEGDMEGWADPGVGSGNDDLAADGDSLNGTSPGMDPQLLRSEPITRAADAQWDRIEFSVRERESAEGEPVRFHPKGLAVVINNGNPEEDGLTVAQFDDFTAEPAEDGFHVITVSIAGYAGQTIEKLRVDPIGGSIRNSNSESVDNLYEIDFIRVYDTAGDAPSDAPAE